MASGIPATRIVIDAYSPLSHKLLVGDPHQPSTGLHTAPSWVPQAERRRIAAYVVRAAYRANVARLLLIPDAFVGGIGDGPKSLIQGDSTREHREYGDADLIVDRVVAGVLGDQWSLVVDGADDDLPDAPDLAPRPDEPPPNAGPLERRVFTLRRQRWDEQAQAAVDRWEADWTARPRLQARQDALREWAVDVQLGARLDEGEHDAAGLGDTVMVLWPRQGGWPRVTVYDPGFYFPVLEGTGDDEDYPTKVHLAWEYGSEGATSARPTHVRRLTFEMVDLTDMHTGGNPESRYWVDGNGDPAGAPDLNAAEEVDDQGRVFRRLPWDRNPDGTALMVPGPYDQTGQPTEVERRSYRTCLVTDATWPLDGLGTDVAALDESKATFRMRRVDLGCDFLPIIHVPNTPSGKEHYGRSVIDTVAQLFDDIGQADTDVMTASRYSAGPVLGLAGAKMDTAVTTVQPGIVYGLGENGRMDVLDLSAGLDKLMEHRKELRDLLHVNGRVPAAIVGRISTNATISGVRLALEMAPFGQLVAVMRMSREPKYRLLPTFAARLAQLQGVLPVGPDIPAHIEFGNFMPNDKAATITSAAEALRAKLISTQTAVAMLVSAGVPVDDARDEVDRIRAENTEAAADIANATGSEQLAADALGLDLPAQGPVPVPPISLPSFGP